MHFVWDGAREWQFSNFTSDLGVQPSVRTIVQGWLAWWEALRLSDWGGLRPSPILRASSPHWVSAAEVEP